MVRLYGPKLFDPAYGPIFWFEIQLYGPYFQGAVRFAVLVQARYGRYFSKKMHCRNGPVTINCSEFGSVHIFRKWIYEPK